MDENELRKQIQDFMDNAEPVTVTLNRATAYALRDFGKAIVDALPQANKLSSEQKLTTIAVHFLLLTFQREPNEAELRTFTQALENAQRSELAELLIEFVTP